MKTLGLAALGAVALAFALPQPAVAQSEYPIDPAGWVEIGMIEIEDGHDLDYANYLAQGWRKSQDYAKAQGWITDYQIWANTNARDGEADIYLVTWFPAFADAAEDLRREKLFLQHMKSTQSKMQAESGKRAEYRRQMGSMLFRDLKWNK
jgi:hypothetical protein